MTNAEIFERSSNQVNKKEENQVEEKKENRYDKADNTIIPTLMTLTKQPSVIQSNRRYFQFKIIFFGGTSTVCCILW